MRNFDEDSFVFPAAWQRHRYARRGSAGLAAFAGDPAARRTVDSLLLHMPGRIGKILDAPTTDAAVAAAGMAWREGKPDAPPAGEFDYSFDALTDLTEALLDRLGVDRYAIYVQDYGAPVGWRLALRDPAGGVYCLTDGDPRSD